MLMISNIIYKEMLTMKIKEILSSVACLEKMHYTPDGYLAFGKYKGVDFCALRRDMDLGHYGLAGEEIKAIAVKPERQDYGYIAFWYVPTNGMEHIVYVFPKDAFLLEVAHDLVPDNYFLAGYTIHATFPLIDINKYNQMASTLVSFNEGPNNSKMPVLWRVDAPTQGMAVYTMNLTDDKVLFSVDTFKEAITNLKQQLPPVDLDTEADKRYVTLEVDDGVYFVYNRNHVAYNGTLSYYGEFAPLVMYLLALYWDEVETENFTGFIAGSVEEDNISIVRKGNESAEPVTASDNFMNKPEENKTYLHEDNILMRAAKAADTNYR